MENGNSIIMIGDKEIKEKKLVGFRVVCDDITGYSKEIPTASMLLGSRKDEIKHLVDPVRLIGAFKGAETTEEDDGYWVCYEVHKFENIPKGMVSLIIPQQKYAVLQFKGHSSKIYHTYANLHQWIDENGYKRLPEKWTLEIYSKWTEDEDNVELCDPVF